MARTLGREPLDLLAYIIAVSAALRRFPGNVLLMSYCSEA